MWGLLLREGKGRGREGRKERRKGKGGKKGEGLNQTFWLRHCVS